MATLHLTGDTKVGRIKASDLFSRPTGLEGVAPRGQQEYRDEAFADVRVLFKEPLRAVKRLRKSTAFIAFINCINDCSC